MPKLGRTHPCAGCPWLRKSAPGWLGDDEPVHFYRSSITNENEMPCHEQIDYDDPDWLKTQLPDVDFCAGTLIHFRNTCKQPRRPSLIEAVRLVTTSPHVFDWPEEFMEHHAPGQDAKELAHKAMWPYGDDD